jgi:integrase
MRTPESWGCLPDDIDGANLVLTVRRQLRVVDRYSGDLFKKLAWRPAFDRAEIVYRKRADGMHALRHFYASVLLAQGVLIKELADHLGHADRGFTSARTPISSRRASNGPVPLLTVSSRRS